MQAEARQWLLFALLRRDAIQSGSTQRDLLQRAAALLPQAAEKRALAELSDCLRQLDERRLPTTLRRAADLSLQWAETPECSLLPLDAAEYPPLLRSIPDPPPLLFVRGQARTLSLPQMALVGSRRPSADGRALARRFAGQLAGGGYQVCSGLAQGIDAESHRGALAAGGVTIAVLGTGPDRIYPRQHRALAAEIVERGALLSEFPPGTGARPWHFPLRNRIISGLSHGVLVVEAAEASGSLITARHAAEQGRAVFAIPGAIRNPLSRGCHRLLRQGAVLVETLDDIRQELLALWDWEKARLGIVEGEGAVDEAADTSALDAEQRRILAQIAYNPVSADELSGQLNLNPSRLYPALMQLELAGFIVCQAGMYTRA